LTADHASDTTPSGSANYWRGYAFQFSMELEITSIIGGIIEKTFDRGYVAFYTCLENGTPQSILGSAEITEIGRRQTFDIDPVTVMPGNWYMIAQGASDSGRQMAPVGYWDVSAMLEEEEIFAAWEPGVDKAGTYQMFGWSRNGDPSAILGASPSTTTWGFTDARPDLGFFYGGYRFMTIWPKVEGIWKRSDSYAKIGGNWRLVTEGWCKEGGVWRQIVS